MDRFQGFSLRIAHPDAADKGFKIARLDQTVRMFCMRHRDCKLIPTQTPDDIGLAHILNQRFGDMPDDRIACGMPETIIDQLEAIKIDVDQAERCSVAFRQSDFAPQFPLEGAAVEHWAKCVAVREEFGLTQLFHQGCTLLSQGKDFPGEGFDRCARVLGQVGQRNPNGRDQAFSLLALAPRCFELSNFS